MIINYSFSAQKKASAAYIGGESALGLYFAVIFS